MCRFASVREKKVKVDSFKYTKVLFIQMQDLKELKEIKKNIDRKSKMQTFAANLF